MRKKLISAAVLAAALMTGLGAALAASGSAGDPFVTLSYITDTYYPETEQAMLQRARDATVQTAQDARAKLDKLFAGYQMLASCQYHASVFTRVSLLQGEQLEVPMGSSLLFESGEGTLRIDSGALVDVTSGSEVTGGELQPGHRYVAAEGAVCSFTAASETVLSVQGYYDLNVSLPFTDVSSTDWFYPCVRYVYQAGLYDGVTPTLFDPQGGMTRAMLTTVLARQAGAPENVPDAGFTDVSAGDWYASAVNWAASNGIVDGMGDGLFAPNDKITREQMATLLYRYAKNYLGLDVSAAGDLSAFPDRTSVSDWAEEAVSWAVGVDLMQGSDGWLYPKGTATRAEAAALLERFSALCP